MRRYFLPVVVGVCIIAGLIISTCASTSARVHLSPPRSADPPRSRSNAPRNSSKPPDMIPAASTGCGGPRRKPLCETIKNNTALPFLAPWMMAHANALGLITAQSPPASRPGVVPDAVQEAQTPRTVPEERPEQRKSAHDRSNIFQASQGLPASQALPNQPDQGKILGFDFSRDPLNAKRPMQPFEEIMHADAQAKPQVMAAQRQLLERRYDLTPRLDPEAKMSRGKPLPVGPTARLAAGTDWNTLAGMTPDAIRQRNLFPYPALPHPKQVAGGQVFPAMQIAMFPRLERFDVDFDLPDAFLPEFPPAIFLQNRPNSATCRAVRSSRSTTSMPCSKICSPRSSSTACAYF